MRQLVSFSIIESSICSLVFVIIILSNQPHFRKQLRLNEHNVTYKLRLLALIMNLILLLSLFDFTV